MQTASIALLIRYFSGTQVGYGPPTIILISLLKALIYLARLLVLEKFDTVLLKPITSGLESIIS